MATITTVLWDVGGVLLTNGMRLRCERALSALDLPELDRPTNATSAPCAGGRSRVAATVVTNSISRSVDMDAAT